MKKKRLLAIACTLALLASMITGCSAGKGSSSGTSESNLNPAGVFPIVKHKITMTAMIEQQAEVSDLVNNSFTKELEKKTNIHLDLQVTPTTNYPDKLKVALSAGTYPELILSQAANTNLDVENYGVSQKIYIPLNKYINQYGVNIKKMWASIPSVRKSMTAPNGNVYCLPTEEGAVGHGAVSYKAWINTDWLNKLKLKMPTTTDDFEAVLKAFKNDDPNGNGQKDEVPLSGAINTWAGDPYLFILNSFGYYDGNTLLKLKNGTFTFCADTDGFKQGLDYLHKLYAEGLYDPATLTQDESSLLKLGDTNPTVLGSFTAGHLAMGIDNSNETLAKEYDAILPLKGSNGYQGTPITKELTTQGGMIAVTDKCKNPAAAVRLCDLMYDMTTAMNMAFGPKGTAWNVADAGAKGVTGKSANWKFLPSHSASINPTNNFWGAATSYGLEKDAKEHNEFTGDLYSTANYEARLIKITQKYMKYPADADQIMPMWTDSDTSTKINNEFTAINDYVKSSIDQFITGQKSVTNDWGSYINGLTKLNYKTYVSDYQKAYKASSK